MMEVCVTSINIIKLLDIYPTNLYILNVLTINLSSFMS